MKKVNHAEAIEKLEKFEVERLTADEMFIVSGGVTGCTTSMCHSDGCMDGDPHAN